MEFLEFTSFQKSSLIMLCQSNYFFSIVVGMWHHPLMSLLALLRDWSQVEKEKRTLDPHPWSIPIGTSSRRKSQQKLLYSMELLKRYFFGTINFEGYAKCKTFYSGVGRSWEDAGGWMGMFTFDFIILALYLALSQKSWILP